MANITISLPCPADEGAAGWLAGGVGMLEQAASRVIARINMVSGFDAGLMGAKRTTNSVI
jgi:hypothetical protein